MFFLPPSKYPGVGLVDHIVVLFFFFLEKSPKLVSNAAPIYIPTNSAWRFLFLRDLFVRAGQGALQCSIANPLQRYSQLLVCFLAPSAAAMRRNRSSLFTPTPWAASQLGLVTGWRTGQTFLLLPRVTKSPGVSNKGLRRHWMGQAGRMMSWAWVTVPRGPEALPVRGTGCV